jgi:UDPglucose 6-dehydrogenase
MDKISEKNVLTRDKYRTSIGIIGNGFVGSAVRFGFSPGTGCDAKVRVYDKDPSKSVDNIYDTVNKSDFIFLSVPTPSNKDGSMNLDIVKQALQDISDVNERDDNVVLLRSTVTPGTTCMLQEQFDNIKIVFNPEFLTERSAKYDFINQARVILGGEGHEFDGVHETAELFRWRFGESMPIIETTWETAELIKYMCNCFFATKVSFMNEMYQIAEKCEVDWETALDGFVRDGRVGHSHMNIPGPDGKLGFGGSCFPKDVQAIINFGETLGINMSTVKGVWETNLEVRPERDWENLKGRAVVDETD